MIWEESNEFVVTVDHIKLLKSAYAGWDDCDYGAPTIDCKRPYGNSGVSHDICQILDWEIPKNDCDSPEWNELEKKARKIHEELRIVLQILLANADVGIKPGLYRHPQPYKVREWRFIDAGLDQS